MPPRPPKSGSGAASDGKADVEECIPNVQNALRERFAVPVTITVEAGKALEGEELFQAMDTRLPLPAPARNFDSYNCECCGEKTGANWVRLVGGKVLCLDCCEKYDRFDV